MRKGDLVKSTLPLTIINITTKRLWSIVNGPCSTNDRGGDGNPSAHFRYSEESDRKEDDRLLEIGISNSSSPFITRWNFPRVS